MNRKMLLLIAAAISTALLVGETLHAQEKEPIKIGALEAMSGPASFLGEPQGKSLQLIVDQKNKSGGLAGHPIELILYDTETNSTKTVQQFRRLIDSDNVQVVIGPSSTADTLLVKPIANDSKVPIISGGATAAVVAPPAEYIFNTPPPVGFAARHMVQYLKMHGFKSFAIISTSDTFGQEGANALRELASEFGLMVTTAEEFGPRDTDMTPQLVRIRGSGADSMIIWGINPGPTIILRNAKAIGYDKPIFNSYGAANPQLITQAGTAGEGTYLSSGRLLAPSILAEDDPVRPVVVKLANDYKAKYGKDAPAFAAHSYDAVLVLEKALEKVQGAITRRSLRDAIETVEVIGANGHYRYSATNHTGYDASSNAMIMLKIKDGKFVRAE